MSLKGKKILVTGASGFIGSHLAEKLVDLGSRVRIFVHYNSRNDRGNIDLMPQDYRKELEIFMGDIRDPYAVRKACKGCDVIFHLAALIAIPYSYFAPVSYFDTNVNGTLNILEAALSENVAKVVHTSTSETYGTAIYVPIDEKHPLQAQSPYSASKIGADKAAESYHLSFDLPVATIRPFNTFGPRQSARAVIPTIISQALNNNVVKLGSLFPVRDLTFVGDTIEAFIKIAESEESVGQVINIGRGEGITIGELAKKIARLIDKDIEIVCDQERIRPALSEVKRLVCDNSKARQLISWQPEYSLDEGLAETIEFIRQHKSNYRPEDYSV
jgi:NAD dependent epimerase/dehydratase